MRTHLNLKIYLYCLLAAILMWTFTKLSKDYEQIITFKVSYIPPSNNQLYVSPQSTAYLDLLVKENGAKIVKWYILPPVIHFDLKNQNKPKTLTFTKEQLMNKIENIGLNRYQIVSSYTEHIQVDILKYDSIQLPITPNIKLSLDPSYQLSKIDFQPSTVTLFGFKKELSTVKASTQPIEISSTDQFQSGNTQIRFSSAKFKKMGGTNISYALELKRYTEQSLEIPITIINQKENMRVKLFPNKITVSGTIPFELANSLTNKTIEATADMSTVSDGDKTILLTLTKSPDFLKSPKLSQSTVEFISIQE